MTDDMDRLFRPRNVAVTGASDINRVGTTHGQEFDVADFLRADGFAPPAAGAVDALYDLQGRETEGDSAACEFSLAERPTGSAIRKESR
jgi:hypothetical protein